MVERLIRQARRRLLFNDTLAQTALAAAVTAGGFVLLLILGTRWLEWWTVAVFAAIGAGIGIYRVTRHRPNEYLTAIRVDRNANLHDTLSTAVHFSRGGRTAGSKAYERFCKAQLEYAERTAQTVVLESAVPFTFPRALYAMAALGLVCSGLIALRYRVGRGLDLRSPITEVLFEDQELRQAKKQGASPDRARQTSWADEAQQMLSKLGITPAKDGPSPSDPDALNEAIEQALQQPDKNGGKGDKGAGGEKAAQGKDGTTGDQNASGDPIDGSDKKSGDPKDGDAKGANSQAADSNDKSNSGKDGDSSGSPRESLMAKLKDAVSNLLSKSQSEQKQQQQGGPSQQAKNDQRKQGKKGDNGQGTPEKSNSDSDSDSDPDGDAMGGQQGQGKETTASNQHQAQEGSGIGAQDGLKDMREAEQIKAMGKISEIIGKRSATVSGETSVEVQSGDQKLHTSYSKSNATHSETDGDVTRDEIPLSLQAYVQQYFQEVHKQAPKKGEAKPSDSQ